MTDDSVIEQAAKVLTKQPRRTRRKAPHGDDCRCVECAAGVFSARPATTAEIADWGYDDD